MQLWGENMSVSFYYDVFLRWIQLQQSCNILMIPLHLSDGIFFVYSCHSIIIIVVIILIKSELYFDFWLKKCPPFGC